MLSSHQLTEIQKVELFFNMDDLGSKRPMELLTEMMELVKPGEEKTQLFAMLFMRRLPPQVRVQLTEDNHADLRALAEKADRCAATLARKAPASTVGAITTGDEEPDDKKTIAVAAVTPAQRGAKKKTGFWQQKKQQSKQQKPDISSPAEMARLSSGLCYPHFKFGGKAHSCQQPCSWQGN